MIILVCSFFFKASFHLSQSCLERDVRGRGVSHAIQRLASFRENGLPQVQLLRVHHQPFFLRFRTSKTGSELAGEFNRPTDNFCCAPSLTPTREQWQIVARTSRDPSSKAQARKPVLEGPCSRAWDRGPELEGPSSNFGPRVNNTKVPVSKLCQSPFAFLRARWGSNLKLSTMDLEKILARKNAQTKTERQRELYREDISYRPRV